MIDLPQLRRLPKNNPLEQLSKFYGFGDDSNAGGMDGNTSGGVGQGSGANGSGGGNDNGNTSDIGGSVGGQNALGANSIDSPDSGYTHEAPEDSLMDSLADMFGSLSNSLRGLTDSLGLTSPQDTTADNNYGGFSVDNGSYSSHMGIETHADGSTSYNYNPDGLMSDSITSNLASGSQLSGGVLASNLTSSLGLQANTSIAVEAVVDIAIAIAFKAPLSAIAPTAKALQAKGVIDEDTSKTLQAVGLVASFMKGTISTMQSASAVADAKSAGAINGMQAAIMGGLIGYSQYSSMQNFNAQMTSLGFAPSTVDMTDFGYTTNGESGAVSLNGIEITEQNFNSTTNAFVMYVMNKNKSKFNSGDFFEMMAGGILFNSFMAGGNMFSPMNVIGSNLIASTTGKQDYSNFAKQTIQGSDVIENMFTFIKT